MDRRSFMRTLMGACATAVVAPRITYVLAPPGGWRLNQRVYTLYGGARGGGKSHGLHFCRMLGETDAQLRVRIYRTMAEVERDFGPPVIPVIADYFIRDVRRLR